MEVELQNKTKEKKKKEIISRVMEVVLSFARLVERQIGGFRYFSNSRKGFL